MRAASYARVSTHDQQTLGLQVEAMSAYIKGRGWDPVRQVQDVGSGAKQRPAREGLLRAARCRELDVVVVWRFDRFARSIEQLVTALAEFRRLGVDFVSAQEALDTSTPIGKAMFTIIAAMAELERNIIRERVTAGLDYARRRGTKSGKPVGRPRVSLIVTGRTSFARRDSPGATSPP